MKVWYLVIILVTAGTPDMEQHVAIQMPDEATCEIVRENFDRHPNRSGSCRAGAAAIPRISQSTISSRRLGVRYGIKSFTAKRKFCSYQVKSLSYT